MRMRERIYRTDVRFNAEIWTKLTTNMTKQSEMAV